MARYRKRRTKKRRKLTAAQKRARRRAYYKNRVKPRRKRLRRAVSKYRKRRAVVDVQGRIDRAKASAISMMGFPPMIPNAEIRAVGGEGQIYHRGKWRPTRWSQGHGSLMLIDGVWTPV